MPSPNAPIPFLTLPNWAAAARACGFHIEPVLRDAGIEIDLLNLDTATVRPWQLARAMEVCVARARGAHFPFVLGETFAFDYLPEISTFLSTSATLREAVRAFVWVRELINPMLLVRLDESGVRARLVIELLGTAHPTGAYFIEGTFAATVKFARALMARDLGFERLLLAYPAPAYAAEYRRFFGTRIDFDQAEHALVFDAALLDAPLEGAFPRLHEQSELLVQRRLTQLVKRGGGLVADIERAFASDPALFAQGLNGMASALGLHPRALQRRLREQSHRYAEIQAQARLRLARDWLAAGRLDLETISERLGFSDRRSFTRAFTRWAGQSPSAFRRKESG